MGPYSFLKNENLGSNYMFYAQLRPNLPYQLSLVPYEKCRLRNVGIPFITKVLNVTYYTSPSNGADRKAI